MLLNWFESMTESYWIAGLKLDATSDLVVQVELVRSSYLLTCKTVSRDGSVPDIVHVREAHPMLPRAQLGAHLWLQESGMIDDSHQEETLLWKLNYDGWTATIADVEYRIKPYRYQWRMRKIRHGREVVLPGCITNTDGSYVRRPYVASLMKIAERDAHPVQGRLKAIREQSIVFQTPTTAAV